MGRRIDIVWSCDAPTCTTPELTCGPEHAALVPAGWAVTVRDQVLVAYCDLHVEATAPPPRDDARDFVMRTRALKVTQAAKRLGIGRDAAYMLIREGRLRHFRVGRNILVPPDAIDEFLTDGGQPG